MRDVIDRDVKGKGSMQELSQKIITFFLTTLKIKLLNLWLTAPKGATPVN